MQRPDLAIPLLLLALCAPPPALAAGLEAEVGAEPAADLAPGAYWLRAARGEGGVTLAGTVPDELTRTVLTTYAAALFGAAQVQSTLALSQSRAPADWSSMAMATLKSLSTIAEGKAEITEEKVLLTGTVPVPEEAGTLTRGLRESLPPGVRVSTELEVDLPALVERKTLPAERCAWLMTDIARERQVLFDSGSAEIDKSSLPGLKVIAQLFGRCPNAEIEVRGYTDDAGDADMNLDLSQARAEAVLAVLQEEGVPLRQLRARGFGEADPIADNSTESGRARNRRIEFEAVEK